MQRIGGISNSSGSALVKTQQVTAMASKKKRQSSGGGYDSKLKQEDRLNNQLVATAVEAASAKVQLAVSKVLL